MLQRNVRMFHALLGNATGIDDIDNNFSMEFDGVDDEMTTGHIESGDFTLSAWINCDGTYPVWLPRYPLSITPTHSDLPNATIGRLYALSTNLYVGLQMYDTAGANFSTYHVQVKMDGAGWKHCVWTFNNTTKAIYFYLNGVAQTWTHWGGVITSAYLTAPGYSYNNALTIGNRYHLAWSTYYFEGKVDEVAVFDYTLTEAQALEIFNATDTDKTADLSSMATPPVAWYRMGD